MMLGIDVYRKHLPNLRKSHADELVDKCPFHDDSTPSFYVNQKTLVFWCGGCGISGNVYRFMELIGDNHQIEPIRVIEDEVKSIEELSSRLIEQLHSNLLMNQNKVEYLIRERKINFFTIKKFLIGYDTSRERFAIPIKSSTGKFVNIKLHNSFKQPKSLNWAEGYGSARLYPYSALMMSRVVLCEGEFDCLALHSLGINAITTTCGVGQGKWNDSWNQDLAGKEVKIIFDSDKAGTEGSEYVKSRLNGFATSVTVVKFDMETNNEKLDITEYILKGGDVFKLLNLSKRR